MPVPRPRPAARRAFLACALLAAAPAPPRPPLAAQPAGAAPRTPAPAPHATRDTALRDTALRDTALRGTALRDTALRAALRRVGARTGGRLTVAAVDVDRGTRLSVDGDVPVFMSSVVKLPLALQLLARVDRGELRLDDTLTLAARDLRPGHSPLAAAHPGGVSLPVAELLRLAVAESDNSASDALLRYSGGPARVTRELRALGVAGVRVDRGYAEYTRDHRGLGALPADLHWTPARADSLTRAVPPARQAAAARRFLADPRDRATADALAALLARLARGELLRPASRALLLRHMTEKANPATRLVAGAPPGATVAHKTGTWGSVAGGFASVSDVGIVTLPGGRGRLALAVLVREPTATLAVTDSAMAEATRAVLAWWRGDQADAPGVTAARDTAPAAPADPCATSAGWNTPQRPFRVYGNTYYVGTRCLSAVLVTSPAGHVLLDAGLPSSAPLVMDNVRALGFRLTDVKLLLNSHAHFDHAGGLAAVRRASGAAVAASPASARVLEAGASGPDDPQYGALAAFPAVRPVRVLADGETVRVGPTGLTAHWTPGHTPGGTSWSWTACEGAGAARRCLDLVYADSQTPVAAEGFAFTKSRTYPAALQDFARGQATLERLACDVLLTPHPDASGLWARLAARDAGQADALVDREACRRYAARARERVARRVADEAAAR